MSRLGSLILAILGAQVKVELCLCSEAFSKPASPLCEPYFSITDALRDSDDNSTVGHVLHIYIPAMHAVFSSLTILNSSVVIMIGSSERQHRSCSPFVHTRAT